MVKLTSQIKEQIARGFLRIEGFEDPRKQLEEILAISTTTETSSRWFAEAANVENGMENMTAS